MSQLSDMSGPGLEDVSEYGGLREPGPPPPWTTPVSEMEK